MLSKNNKILIGCLALLLAMSIGYALFSDTITVNGTATAKGNFDMTATCESGISSKFAPYADAMGLKDEGGYEKDSCSVVDDVVSPTVNFLYPGARRYFTLKIKNTGTIDAEINMNKFTRSAKLCYSLDKDSIADDCHQYPTAGGSVEGELGLLTFMAGAKTMMGMTDANDNILAAEELNVYYDVTNNIITLPANYSGYIALEFSIDGYTPTNVLNAKMTSSLEFPFVQKQ